MDAKQLRISAALLGATGVIAGAFGAHALSSKTWWTDHKAKSWSTAVSYQLVHAVAVLAISGGGSAGPITLPPMVRRAATAWVVGTTLFSGSIYLLCVHDALQAPPKAILGPATPVGGLIMIGGWLMTLWHACK